MPPLDLGASTYLILFVLLLTLASIIDTLCWMVKFSPSMILHSKKIFLSNFLMRKKYIWGYVTTLLYLIKWLSFFFKYMLVMIRSKVRRKKKTRRDFLYSPLWGHVTLYTWGIIFEDMSPHSLYSPLWGNIPCLYTLCMPIYKFFVLIFLKVLLDPLKKKVLLDF